MNRLSRWVYRATVSISSGGLVVSSGAAAFAQTPMGTPPPEAKAIVEGPKGPGDAPKIESKTDGTTVTLSSGGQASTGNSRLLAFTANGAFETRFSNNGLGFAALANYGRSAPPGQDTKTTTENFQGRFRYDRYIIDEASFFLIATGRHDRFQGIDFRLNLDPGFKYLFIAEQTNAVWAEAGYDFQYDVRRDDALVDAMGVRLPIDKTGTDHSARLFFGARHAFNEQVTLAAGVEYLQSFVETTRNRVNFDAVFAAKVGGGLAIGLGFTARYDHAPLPGKEQLDTSTNVSLIYAFSQKAEAPLPPPPPAPATPPPPVSAPSGDPVPSSSPTPATTPPTPATTPSSTPPSTTP